MTLDRSATAAPLSDEELAAITARLPIGGLFAAHAHTDMTRLIAEIHRLRKHHTDRPRSAPAEQGADR